MAGPPAARTRTAARFLRDRAGNAAMMAATLLFVVVAAAALAVDQGSIYFERREAQALTDLAAITAAAHLERAPDAALITFTDNDHRNIVLMRDEEPRTGPLETVDAQAELYVETGRYEADPEVEPVLRFTVGGDPPNAVRVTYRKKGTLYFGNVLMDEPTMATKAVAATREEASISVGSRLASVDGGILNAALGALLGTELSLKAADYRALVETDVDALTFLDALATEVNATAVTYDEVLTSEATIGQILRSLSANIPPNSGAQIALQGLLGSAGGGTLKVPLSSFIDLGRLGRLMVGQDHDTGLKTAMSVMDVIGASAAIANRERQITLSLPVNIPGLLAVTVDLVVGEPPAQLPWFAVGEAGTTARTAQIRLRIVATVDAPGLPGDVIRLPLYIEAGYAEARLRDVVCEAGRLQRVIVDGRPGVFEAWVGEVDRSQMSDFHVIAQVHQPATLVNALLVRITGAAHVYAGNMYPETRTFTSRDIEDGRVQTVHTSQLAQPIVQSLLSNLRLRTQIGGLGIGFSISALEALLRDVLAGVTEPVDDVVFGLLTALGVRVGEADLRVSGADCKRAVLVH